MVQHSIYADPASVQTWQQVMLTAGVHMLTAAGFPVRQRSSLFVEADFDARFVLAGRVDGLEYNTYGPLAGNRVRAAMLATWELMDRYSRRVVYSRQTRAEHQVQRRDEGNLLSGLFAQLLGPIISDTAFRDALARSVSPPAQPVLALNPPTGVQWRRGVVRESDIIIVRPEDLRPSRSDGGAVARAVEGVVSLVGDRGHGTAFVITRDGLALTNHHVVDGQHSLVAHAGGGRTYAVRVLRSDAEADVALVELACSLDCTTLPVTSLPPSVGADIYLIGTPLSEVLDHTVTKGIVSGQRRAGPISIIQTDAAVNPGNSGGPMINTAGEVVGIVTSKIVGRDVEGLGFAVSVVDALRVMGIRY
jgi:S1-C subfamily serine protease